MPKEKLCCQLCKSVWSRTRSRGRKPRFCASCIKKNLIMGYSEPNSQDFIDEVDNYDQLESIEDIVDDTPNQKLDPKNKRHWICPKCSLELTTYVGLSQPPICNNPASHTSSCIEMVLYNRKEEKIASYA
jgi:rubrerythrin